MTWLLTKRILFLVGWTTFTYWTVRRFWRQTEDPDVARLQALARTSGLFMTLFTALVFALHIDLPALNFWQTAVFWAVIAFPIMLWGMHFFFRTLNAVLSRYFF